MTRIKRFGMYNQVEASNRKNYDSAKGRLFPLIEKALNTNSQDLDVRIVDILKYTDKNIGEYVDNLSVREFLEKLYNKTDIDIYDSFARELIIKMVANTLGMVMNTDVDYDDIYDLYMYA